VNNLVYLTYGQGPHIDELVYSVLSARQLLGRNATPCRIIIYTDDGSPFRDLAVHIECKSRKVLSDWAGPLNFNHRRKIFAIKDALSRFGDRILYCDADTYFLTHPGDVFSRIQPGHTVMHMREGYLNESNAAGLEPFFTDTELRTVRGARWKIGCDTLMFNAGVIGMHEADIGLLDEIVYLTDQIYPHVKIHTIEQFAFSVCLRQRTELREAYDVICHYWPMPGRALFREELRRLLHDPSIGSNEERLHRISACRPMPHLERPEPTLKQRLYFAFKRVKGAARTSRFRLGNLPAHFHAARRP
jgi:hypothetical protein